jgi:deoxyribodipyrimidine photolyase-related protein
MTITVWIPGDQLLLHHPALVAAAATAPRQAITVLLIESEARKRKLPYQRKKLVLLISAMRHYAQELAAAGYRVDYRRAPAMGAGLRAHLAEQATTRLFTMETAEAGGSLWQQRLATTLGIPVTLLPNTQFLLGRFPQVAEAGPKKVILEQFYRAMRRRLGLLLEPDGSPTGGAWNFDKENRRPWPMSGLPLPPVPSFAPDAITRTVMAEAADLPGVGTVEGFDLAVTRADAAAAFADFLRHRLPNFGPYEDAMTRRSATLFHSVLSPYMNIGLLDPLAMAQQAEAEYRAGRAPLASVEGFIRQVVGWREYVYWHYRRQMPGLLSANGWHHTRPLPRFFWDGQTDMNCLRQVIHRVIDTGYSHHIERLMVLCNFCMLAGVDPAAVHRWFLSFYVDAYEWVVAPNVIGMGLNADGGQTATKPYVASANYLAKMSDYCPGCRYNPALRTGEDACPFNYLYWDFLARNEAPLRANPRSGPAVLGLKHLTPADRAAVRQAAAEFLDKLEPYEWNDKA